MHGPILEDARIESATRARAEHSTNKLVEREPKIRKVAVLLSGAISVRNERFSSDPAGW